jgi:hypothetical protein
MMSNIKRCPICGAANPLDALRCHECEYVFAPSWLSRRDGEPSAPRHKVRGFALMLRRLRLAV